MDLRYFAVDNDLELSSWITSIKDQMAEVGINFNLTTEGENTIRISVPDSTPSCLLGLAKMPPDFSNQLVGFDSPETGYASLDKQFLLTLKGDRSDKAVNFIFNLTTKALGPISKGTMIDPEMNYFTDDWITWGYDYVDGDMFKAFNSVGLDSQYPSLRR